MKPNPVPGTPFWRDVCCFVLLAAGTTLTACTPRSAPVAAGPESVQAEVSPPPASSPNPLPHVEGGDAASLFERGVQLIDEGQGAAALAHFTAAANADPSLTSAHYNAGQLHYNRGEYQEALQCWERALALAPDDFATLKKVTQAHYALGHFDKGLELRRELRQAWNASTDEAVRDGCDIVFDQFQAAGYHVLVSERFGEQNSSVLYHIIFAATQDGQIVRTVQLESNRILPGFLVGTNWAQGHATFAIGFKTMPPYPEVKALVIEILEGKHQPASTLIVR